MLRFQFIYAKKVLLTVSTLFIHCSIIQFESKVLDNKKDFVDYAILIALCVHEACSDQEKCCCYTSIFLIRAVKTVFYGPPGMVMPSNGMCGEGELD